MQTAREVAFLQRMLPLPEFSRVLDVCCGYGRHAARLAAAGYSVVGIEVDPAVAEEARRRARGAEILVQDARALDGGAPADAAIVMWASFGWYGDEEDGLLLARIGAALRAGGRLVLDVYRPGFFRSRLGVRERDVNGRRVVETKAMRGEWLTVELDYGSGVEDRFAWRLYEPEELEALASPAGLRLLLAGAEFDEVTPPRDDLPRMQLVLERRQ